MLYDEVQRDKPIWLWAVVIVVAAIQWWGFFQQIVQGQPFGNNPGPDWLIILMLILVGIAFPIAVAITQLRIAVGSDGIQIVYRPFMRRIIPFSDIQSAVAREYKPLREFGGWGIRSGLGGKRAYTMSGTHGVELTLTNGKTVLIGTPDPEALLAAVNLKIT